MAIKYRLADKEKDKAEEIINRLNEISNNSTSTNKTTNTKIEENQPNSSMSLKLPLLNQDKTTTIDQDTLLNNLSNMNPAERVSTIRGITRNQQQFEQLNQETIEYQLKKEATEKASKINEDMSKGNYGSAVEHVVSGVPQKYVDTTNTTISSLYNILPHNKYTQNKMLDKDIVLKTNKALTSKYEDTTRQIDNGVIQTASNVSGTIGQMVPSILADLMLPGSGRVVQGINVGAGAYQDTLNDDFSNKGQALATGLAKGYASYKIEGLTGGNFLGKGSLDDMATRTIASKFSSEFGKKVASKIYEFGGEIAEEELENQIDYIIDKMINGKDLPNAEQWWNEAGETTKNTFLTTLVLQLLGLGGNTYNDVSKYSNDLETQQYIKEAEKIIKKEGLDTKLKENIENKTQQNQANNQVNTQEQQTISQENKITQNQNIEQTENHKQQQLDIIKNTNPMTDDYHTGIRNINDINTFEEALKNDGYENNDYTPDYSNEDIKKALDTGKITVYSSYPIENGIFVTPSKMEAQNYAGKGKVYSKEVNLNDVAWIDGLQGQYAKVENVANNSKKVYNIINKSITNSERAQVDSEVRTNRTNQPDGIGYIDLSAKGFNSYIYNKQGSTTETLLKVNGSEDFKNFIRKGIENGTFTGTEGFNKSITDIRNEYRRYRNDNDLLSRERANNPNDKLSTRLLRQEGDNNTTNNTQQSSGNESIEDSNRSSFILPKADKTIQDVGLPKAENTTTNQDMKQSTEKADILPVTPEQKARKHYKSIMESNYTTDEAKAIAKELLGLDTYVPESNNKQLERADNRIQTSGADSELNSLMSRAINGGEIKADDIAVGERLIQYYSKIGDKVKLQEAIQATAMAGTAAGQTVQAMSLLNHQTPEGQAVWLQRSVEKMNNDLKKARGQNAEQFNLTPEMIEKIVNSQNAEELQNNLDSVYEELGQQVTKTNLEKLDSWRYFCMLSSPKTHIRNIIGNASMGLTQNAKNKVAGAIEGIVAKFNPEMERTHTVVPASEEVKQFAKNDIKNVADRLELNENKYNPKTRLENSMRTFKSDTLENTVGKVFNFNEKALSAEDAFGLKRAYVKALSEYMTANKLTSDNITDKQLATARNYAVEQAKEATFHQENAIASALNTIENKNKGLKLGLNALLPFKKTPANIAKSSIEYSPVGLTKSVIYDTVQLRKGNITANQYIDNISKGLTGTGIALLGYALADAGILKASGGDDDKKEQYDQNRGEQTYSLKIGDNTYSLDWLAPSGVPLFIGAEIRELVNADLSENYEEGDNEKTLGKKALNSVKNIVDAMTKSVDPLMEMSMLGSIDSALTSYEDNKIKGIMINASKSYVNQYIPTLLGQIAKTTDEYERSTTSTETGIEKAIDSTKNQIISKIPGLRQTLPIKTNNWGEDTKQSNNIVQRALENIVLPYTRKEVTTNNVDKEIIDLYEDTGEGSILPSTVNKKITINKQNYTMTSEEYAKYKKQYGETTYKLLNDLTKSSQYNKMTNTQKQETIEKVYEYAKEQVKVDYAKEHKLSYEESKLSQTVNVLKKDKANVSNYFEYLGQTQNLDKDKEKINVLANANYSDKTKEAIYSNSIGADDNLYSIMKNSGINISEYLKYKIQEFESDKEDDGTTTGKTVSGSKKAKVYDYVNDMNLTYNQKLLLLGTQYSLTNDEKTALANYVNSLDISKNEKLNIYSKLKGFTTYKDGRVKW